MRAVFTIVTNSHIPQGLAALRSIRDTHSTDAEYFIFVVDNELCKMSSYDNINIINITDINLPEFDILLNNAFAKIKTKYELMQRVSPLDTIRWALKPCIISWMLLSYNEIVYIDSDLYFIDTIENFIEDTINISLSPHFRPYGTTEIFDWMKDKGIIGDSNVFTDGYFNGGLIIVKNTSTALMAINWWKKCCIHKCEINKEFGFYVDQKYLDFMYMHFDGIQKINDLGCNIAEWNIYSYNISNIDLSKRFFLINNKFQPRFFHFSGLNYKNNKIMHFFHQEFSNLINYYKHSIANII